MGTLKQIAVNTLTSWVSTVLRVIIAFLMVPFLLRHLGKEGYGLIGLLTAVVSFSEVADLGLRSALGRELSEQLVRRDQDAFDELASSALLLYLGIAVMLVAAVWILAPWLAAVFRVPEAMQSMAVVLLRCYGTGSLLFSFVTPVFTAALISAMRFDLVNSVLLFTGVLSNLALFPIIGWSPYGLVGWVVVVLAFQLFNLAALYLLFRRQFPASRMGWSRVNLRRLVPLFHLGWHMYALQLTGMLAEGCNPLIVSFFYGPAGLALYTPGAKLPVMFRPVTLSITNQLFPLTTRQHVEGNLATQQQILIQGTRSTMLIGVLFAVGMMVFALPLTRLWLLPTLGDDHRTVAFLIMGWAVVDFLTYAAGSQWPILLGMNRLGFLVWTQLPAAVLNVIISVILVGYSRLGITGVIAATILIALVRRPIMTIYVSRVCRLPLAAYWREGYSRPLYVTALLVVGALGFRHLLPVESYAGLGAAIGLTSMLWGGLVWTVGLTAGDRGWIMGKVRALVRSGGK